MTAPRHVHAPARRYRHLIWPLALTAAVIAWLWWAARLDDATQGVI